MQLVNTDYLQQINVPVSISLSNIILNNSFVYNSASQPFSIIV